MKILYLAEISKQELQNMQNKLNIIEKNLYTPDISQFLYCYILFELILIGIVGFIHSRREIRGVENIIESIVEVLTIPVVISVLLQPTLIGGNIVLLVVCVLTLIIGLPIIAMLSGGINRQKIEKKKIDSVIFLPGENYEVFSDNCEMIPNTTNTKISVIDKYVIIGGKIKNLNVKNIKLMGEKGKVEIKPERKGKIYRYKTEELIKYCNEKSILPKFKIVIETE